MLPRKYKQTLYFIIFVLALVFTSNTYLKELLPKDLQRLLPTPAPTVSPTYPPADEQVKGVNVTTYISPPLPTNIVNTNRQQVKVTKIADGDTITIEGGQKLRYIGIDTPESVDPRQGVQCYGKEASARNKELVLGAIIELEKDVSEIDRFGRLLRYVYKDGVMINEQLVREGYALASAYPPDIKYQEQLEAAELEAKNNKRGLWAVCPL